MRQRRQRGDWADEGVVGGHQRREPRRECRPPAIERLQRRTPSGTSGAEGHSFYIASHSLRETGEQRPQPHRQPSQPQQPRDWWYRACAGKEPLNVSAAIGRQERQVQPGSLRCKAAIQADHLHASLHEAAHRLVHSSPHGRRGCEWPSVIPPGDPQATAATTNWRDFSVASVWLGRRTSRHHSQGTREIVHLAGKEARSRTHDRQMGHGVKGTAIADHR